MQPGVVRMDKAVADGLVVRPGPLTRDPANEKGHYAPSGVFGDATLASWRKGQVVVEAQVADILKDLDALAGEPIPPGEPGSPLARYGAPRGAGERRGDQRRCGRLPGRVASW